MNRTDTEINKYLEEKRGIFAAQLSLKQEITYPSGRKYIELDNAQLNRLDEEYTKITRRSQGVESFVYMFHFVFENAKAEIPPIPEVELFEYALDLFEATSSRNSTVSEEIRKWCHQPIEAIIDEYAKLLAYQTVIYRLKRVINNHALGIADPDCLSTKKNEAEQEAAYFAILGSKKEVIAAAIAEFLLNEDYISSMDMDIAKRHFLGEYGLPRMNFTKDLSLLIRLLGNISELFHSELTDKHFGSVRHQPIKQHFTYKGKEITKSNWEKTRARYKGVSGTIDHTFRPIEKFTTEQLKAFCPS